MDQEAWTAVDQYFNDLFIAPDAALDAALRDSEAAGLPPHNVAPNQGKLLHLLAKSMGARRILEIGTLGGYSTIWLARALPSGGRLITLEADPRNAQVASRNIARAGLADRVEIVVGRALDSLPNLVGPFDLIFIDADKPGNPDYLAWALKLSRMGTMIIGDNVVRNGAVVDAENKDPSVQGVRRFSELMGSDPRLCVTAVQTVGSKGWDGFTLALVADG